MADLSYNDVQRAVQEGVRNMQADVQRLVNDMHSQTNQVQWIDDMQRQITDISRIVHELHNHSGRSGNAHVEQRVAMVQQDIQELKIRFAVIEQFARQMSEYMQRRHEEDEENRRYKKV